MFAFKSLLNPPTPSRVLLMPIAPLAVALPNHAEPDALLPFLEEVATFHLAAFIALNGPPPIGVTLHKLQVAEAGEDLRPHYACRFESPLSQVAAFWVDAFPDGLESWSEAGFPDPISQESAGPGQTTYAVAPFTEALKFACQRYRQEGRRTALTGLADYFGDAVPDNLNPASRYFTGFHRERRE